MTKEKIQMRLSKLREELAQLQANCQAYGGAIQEAQYWLSQIDEEEVDKEKPDA